MSKAFLTQYSNVHDFFNSVLKLWELRREVSPGAKQHLEEAVIALAQSLQPGPEDRTVRQDAIDRLNRELRQIFAAPSELHLLPFGSYRSSCFSRNSDLDLALTGRVEADLVGRFRGPKTVELVKAWAKHHGINSAPDYTFNSWTLELLCVFRLQTFPVLSQLLPPLWMAFKEVDSWAETCRGLRPLQEPGVTRERLEAKLREVEIRLNQLKEEERAFKASVSVSEDPSLMELFRWFLHFGGDGCVRS